jgi:hypothetical protein
MLLAVLLQKFIWPSGMLESDQLRVQRDFQRFGKLVRIKRASCKKASVNLQRGNLAAAIVCAKDKLFGVRRFVDIYFPKWDLSLAEKLFGSPAVAAPARGIDDNFSHLRPDLPS